MGHDDVDVLSALSHQSFDADRGAQVDGGSLFYESDRVTPAEDDVARSFGLQATDIAFKEFGRKIIANMLMIGFVNENAGLVSHDSLLRTIEGSVPPGTEKLNIAALKMGARLASAQMGVEK